MTVIMLILMVMMTTIFEAAQTVASHLLAWDSPRLYT